MWIAGMPYQTLLDITNLRCFRGGFVTTEYASFHTGTRLNSKYRFCPRKAVPPLRGKEESGPGKTPTTIARCKNKPSSTPPSVRFDSLSKKKEGRMTHEERSTIKNLDCVWIIITIICRQIILAKENVQSVAHATNRHVFIGKLLTNVNSFDSPLDTSPPAEL